LRLACPACGRGRLFRRYFVRAERCSKCGHEYERENGYWVGGAEVHMFFSYGLSVLICVPILIVFGSSTAIQCALIAGHVILSLLLFRYARAVFLAIDYRLDPVRPPADGDGGLGAIDPVGPRMPPRPKRVAVKPRHRPAKRKPVARPGASRHLKAG
jgi:uncharacterized protein (DUF983 family)